MVDNFNQKFPTLRISAALGTMVAIAHSAGSLIAISISVPNPLHIEATCSNCAITLPNSSLRKLDPASVYTASKLR